MPTVARAILVACLLPAISTRAGATQYQVADNCVTLGSPAVQTLAELRVISPGRSQNGRQDHSPELSSLFGAGVRYSWQVKPQDGLEGEIWVSFPADKEFLLVGGELKAVGPAPVYVHDLPLCEIRITRQGLDTARLLINSGSQGVSGSFGLNNPESLNLGCTQVTAFQSRDARDCLGIGFVSLRRTIGHMARRKEGQTLIITPILSYQDVRLDAGRSLRLETLIVNTNPRGACHCLEAWADAAAAVVQPRFSRSMVGFYNTWYAYWTPTSDHGTEALVLKAGDELQESGLINYGIGVTSPVVFHNRGAFSEHETWPGLFPHGRPWMVAQLRSKGVDMMDGGFWGLVSECATVFKEHPEWAIRDKDGKPKRAADTSWGACPFPCYAYDFTAPKAAEWFRQHAVAIHSSWGCKFFWLDFFSNGGGLADGWHRSDETVTYIEGLRRVPQIVRSELGEHAVIGTYTSQTNALTGLVDRVRMAADVGGIDPPPARPGMKPSGPPDPEKRWVPLQMVARTMAAAYFYNDKLWINDPDPIMVGRVDNPQTLEEARIRMMICVNSGGFPTVGEAISHMDPGRLNLLKKALPVAGRAARPIDLMETDVPRIHLLSVPHPSGDYHVLTLFNWDSQPRTESVSLDKLGLSAEYHVFEFWTQTYHGRSSHTLRFEVPARSCRVLRLSSTCDRPQIVGTDRHVLMGLQELPEISWNQDNAVLSGIAARPRPEKGVVTLVIPPGWAVASGNGATLGQGASITRAEIEFVPNGKMWSIGFRHSDKPIEISR